MARTATKKRKQPEPKWETHVYLTETDYSRLKALAEQECRSVTAQIMYFIRRGLDGLR